MKKEMLKELEVKINGIISELWEIIPDDSVVPHTVRLKQDTVNDRLMSAAAHVRDLIEHYTPKPDAPKPTLKPAVTLGKFNEIDVKGVARKIGWEMEACYELIRAAENQEGQLVMVKNDGSFDDGKETFEVGIVLHRTGDFKNHSGLTREVADRVFESYL